MQSLFLTTVYLSLRGLLTHFQPMFHLWIGTIQKVRNGKGVGGYQHIPLREAKIASFFPTIKRDKGCMGV